MPDLVGARAASQGRRVASRLWPADAPLVTEAETAYLGVIKIFRWLFGGWPSRAAFFALDDDVTQGQETEVGLPQAAGLEARIASSIAPTLGQLGYELVRVSVLGRDRPTVQVMADRADGRLIGIEDCERISRAISAVLDVEDPIPGAWALEVSSAGIDRPLARVKDWNRFAGHQARAELLVPLDGRRRFVGIILGADEQAARLRLDDGSEVSVPLAQLRRAKLVLTDALIDASARMMGAETAQDDEAQAEDAGSGQADTEQVGEDFETGQRRQPVRRPH